MPALNFLPLLSIVAQFGRSPAAPLRILLRTAGHKLRPPRPADHFARVRRRQDEVLARGAAGPHQFAPILTEQRPGPQPTIVVGGFVPDAIDSVYLLRGGLLQEGSLYYVNYPRRGFSIDLFRAQLGDLIEETAARHHRPPVVIAISFGAGLVLELLRRGAAAGAPPLLAGLVLVSPVACTEDLLDPATPKPSTLLGRVVKPYLDRAGPGDAAATERARAVFLKMFESGAQNRAALALLLTRDETDRLRAAVATTINLITPSGAGERVRALAGLAAPSAPRVLSCAPTLVLYAEKESAVLVDNAPTRREFLARLAAWFPHGRCLLLTNTPDNPVQHASMIFHVRNFEPPITAFYRALRRPQSRAA